MYRYQYPHPAVTVDACLFTIQEQQLMILLIRRGLEPFKDNWALPGGFIHMDEDGQTAVADRLKS